MHSCHLKSLSLTQNTCGIKEGSICQQDLTTKQPTKIRANFIIDYNHAHLNCHCKGSDCTAAVNNP